jgi:hypothetical protein
MMVDTAQCWYKINNHHWKMNSNYINTSDSDMDVKEI